jgi:1-acyl-sn-glycerol-3-phosphate acyltransferase
MTKDRPYGWSWWRQRALARIRALIAWYLPHAAARSLRLDLAGVWGIEEADPPGAGAVVVANHNSWWDGYLAHFIARRRGRPLRVLVDGATLERYPFFEHLGALPSTALRRAIRSVAEGAWLFVFPEGRTMAAGTLGRFEPGAAAIARLADAPVVPMAWRVVMRGAQYPEVYVRSGRALPSGASAAQQRTEVAALLARIDRDLAAADDPEAPLPDYALWNAGRRSGQVRVARWRRWWGAP